MVDVRDIEKAVQQLAPVDLARFRRWFLKFDAARWDWQFEADAKAGKLDALADQALDDLRRGRCKEL